MDIGQRVKINMPDTIWHDKEGVVEDINDSICTVFVDFIPEEGKKIRQDFNLENINETLKESLKNKSTNEIGDIVKDFNNGFVLFKTKDGKQSQVAKDELEEVEETENLSDKEIVHIELTPQFKTDLDKLESKGRSDEFDWFFSEEGGSVGLLRLKGFDEAMNRGRVELETRSSNDIFNNKDNITVYALKKGVGSGNQFRAYFYRDGDTCVFVRGHIKKQSQNGPKEYGCIQDTINYASKSIDNK